MLFCIFLSIFAFDLRQTIKQGGGTEQIYLGCSDCCSYHVFVMWLPATLFLSLFCLICFFICLDYCFLEAYKILKENFSNKLNYLFQLLSEKLISAGCL